MQIGGNSSSANHPSTQNHHHHHTNNHTTHTTNTEIETITSPSKISGNSPHDSHLYMQGAQYPTHPHNNNNPHNLSIMTDNSNHLPYTALDNQSVYSHNSHNNTIQRNNYQTVTGLNKMQFDVVDESLRTLFNCRYDTVKKNHKLSQFRQGSVRENAEIDGFGDNFGEGGRMTTNLSRNPLVKAGKFLRIFEHLYAKFLTEQKFHKKHNHLSIYKNNATIKSKRQNSSSKEIQLHITYAQIKHKTLTFDTFS